MGGGNSKVVKEWRSEDGTSWYRVWDNGFIEQGGHGVSLNDNSEMSITLNIAFNTLTYQVFCNFDYDAQTEKGYGYVSERSKTGFNLRVFDTNYFWYAVGY